MRKAYWRCNSAHYYSALHCPFDGWTFEGCKELIAAVEKLVGTNAALSIDALALEGVPAKAIERTIIIEFGKSQAVFDAFSPDDYLVDGKHKKVHDPL
ncbi:MAG: hypothetical protein WBD45_01605 [Terriglobales bacterium]